MCSIAKWHFFRVTTPTESSAAISDFYGSIRFGNHKLAFHQQGAIHPGMNPHFRSVWILVFIWVPVGQGSGRALINLIF